MADSYMKDIIYDLIESKLKIKDMEYKMLKLVSKNEELTTVNNNLKDEVNIWKTQVVSYMNDYRDMYNKSNTNECKQEVVNEIIIETENENNKNIENVEDNTKKSRSEYMKEYMRNKRKQEKEELKKIIVNKK